MVSIYAPPAVAQKARNLKCNGCVNSKDIKDNSIKPKDLRTPTAICFNDTPSSDSTITAADEIVGSLTCNIPGPGVVVVTASGTAAIIGDNARGQCSVTKTATLDPGHNFYAGGTGYDGTTTLFLPFGGSRGFAEAAGGNQTYNLVCEQFSADFNIQNVLMIGVYSATDISVP
jgi:hypothetical protein